MDHSRNKSSEYTKYFVTNIDFQSNRGYLKKMCGISGYLNLDNNIIAPEKFYG